MQVTLTAEENKLCSDIGVIRSLKAMILNIELFLIFDNLHIINHVLCFSF